VALGDAHGFGAEAVDAEVAEALGEDLARRRATPPQDPGPDGGLEPALQPVHELVGGVAVHAHYVADLGGRQAVTELEVEDLDVALGQGLGRLPDEGDDLGVLDGGARRDGAAEAVLDAEARRCARG
jgi:hypothetical protein